MIHLKESIVAVLNMNRCNLYLHSHHDSSLIAMDNFLDDLQQMLVETESIHQTLLPLCSRFKVACQDSQETYQDGNLQEPPVSFDRGIGISDEEKKLTVRYLQLQNEFDALNAKFLEAEKKLQKLEVQAKIDKETSDLARSALEERVEAHKRAAEDANAKLAQAISATSTGATTQSSTNVPSSTPAPGSPV
jgi:hypothetical protein